MNKIFFSYFRITAFFKYQENCKVSGKRNSPVKEKSGYKLQIFQCQTCM